MNRRDILLGVLLGQLLMLPYIHHLIKTPKIVATTIPSKYYDFNQTTYLEIKNLPNVYHIGGSTLHIYIASEENVNAEYQRENNDMVRVAGFFSPKTNTIWCVYDPLVLHHEIKHVTEGDYHR